MSPPETGPAVCVVIATHNRAEMLRECVGAVLAQEDVPGGFEVIVVDSASADDTPAVADELARNHPQTVRVVREDEPGCARARNRGARETAADRVAFLDDDAVPQPGWLAELMRTMDREDAAAVGGRVETLWPANRPRWIGERIAPLFDVLMPATDDVVDLEEPLVPVPGNMLIRRDLFRTGGGFREDLGRKGASMSSGEDRALFAGLRAEGYRLVFAPGAVVRHCVHSDRLRYAAVVSKMREEGIADARIGAPVYRLGYTIWAIAFLPAFVLYNVFRRRWDVAAFEIALIVRYWTILIERIRMRFRPAPSGDRVCAIYPLLPDASRFVADARDRMKGARIDLYTGNSEAAERAADGDTDAVSFLDWREFRFRCPGLDRGERFRSIVLYAESEHLYFHFHFFLQSLVWPAEEKWIVLDGNWMRLASAIGPVLRAMWRAAAKPVLVAAVANLIWLAALPFALCLGRMRGRVAADASTLLGSTRVLWTSPQPYAVGVVVPRRLRVLVRATLEVLGDFARPRPVPEPRSPLRVLIVRMDRIGDMIVTTSLLDALKAMDPPAEITLVCAPWTEAVVAADDRVDRLLVYPTDDIAIKRLPSTAAHRRARAGVRAELRASDFDAVFDPANYVDSASLLYLPRARKRVSLGGFAWYGHGLAIVEPIVTEHETERLARLARAAGLPVQPQAPSLRLGTGASEAAEAWLASSGVGDRPFLFVHPGAGSSFRKWDARRFAEIAVRAGERFGLIPVASFVSGEEEAAERFSTRMGAVETRAPFDLPLETVFGLIARAGAFVGNDSAFMHAAAALGVPTLGVFGPSEFTHWRPIGKRAVAVSLHLKCSPCGEAFCTDRRCLSELDADAVWDAFAALMEEA